MRLSVAAIKKNSFAGLQEKPRQGTHLRALYDVLAPGKAVHRHELERVLGHKATARAIDNLNTFYELDIRCLGRGFWCRVGEWKGRVYVDHLAAVARAP